MQYLFSNEITFRGHPDKVADQISDRLLDAYLEGDKNSRCGIEVVGGKDTIFVTGEATSNINVNVEDVVRSVLNDVGYRTNYTVINNIGQQSQDIAQGVDTGGAGDQGMMFGFACRETPEYLPKAMVILQKLSQFYDKLQRTTKGYLPDGKAQITGVYDCQTDELLAIKDFTISYQNTEEDRKATDAILKAFVIDLCKSYGIAEIENFYINPTGRFLIGGFDGDAGLTGRKLLVDNYHSFGKIGGGAFSGKDPTKVDRSGAYKARQLAIECLELTGAKWAEVQLSYAIGVEEPLAVYISTDQGVPYDATRLYDECTPRRIIEDLNLSYVKYYETAMYGHFGFKQFPWERVSQIDDQ